MATDRRTDSLFRTLLIVLAVIVLFPMLMMVFAVPMMGTMGWWWGGDPVGGVSPLWGFGMMLVWLGVFVGLGYLGYRWLRGGAAPALATDTALEELRLAYARGDLTEEEFEARRETLDRDRSR